MTHPGFAVVTDLAVLDIEPATAELRIAALMPGVSVEQVREMTGFELLVAHPLGAVEPPSREDVRMLREEIDPGGLYLKEGR